MKFTYKNIYGRRFRRGSRPYFLILKIFGIAMFLGGCMTILIQIVLHPAPTQYSQWQYQIRLIQETFDYIIIPGVSAAVLAGIALLLPIFKPIARMRWFQVKAIVLVLQIPTLHVFMRYSLAKLHHKAIIESDLIEAAYLLNQIYFGLAAAVLMALILICLGRIKPRLGQKYGRSIFLKRD